MSKVTYKVSFQKLNTILFSPKLNTCAKKGMECKNVIGYHQCHCGKGKTRDPRTDTCIGKLHNVYIYTLLGDYTRNRTLSS